MAIHIEVSIGEFLDKLAILEIKDQRIQDATKLANVRRELQALRAAWTASPHAATDIRADYASLKAINERLWEIEDRIRAKEAAGRFDGEFVELARSVYRSNDERAAVKRRINLRFGSALIEEKSYGEAAR